MTRRRPKLAVLVPVVFGLMLVLVFGTLAGSALYTRSTAVGSLLLESGRAMHSLGARMLFNTLYNLDVEAVQATVDRFLGDTNVVHAVVRDMEGEVVAATTGGWLPKEDVSRELSAQALTQGEIVHRQVGDHFVLLGPIAVGAEQIGTLELVLDQAPLQAQLGRGYQIMLPTFLVLFAVALILTVVLTRSIGTSLGRLTAAAEEIGGGSLDRPVPILGFDESAQVGMALERMRVQLQEAYGDLGRQVAIQERRATRLRAVVEAARETTVELDMSVLLPRIVASIGEQFGFYYAAVYVVDESGDWVELRAASGAEGQRMLARGKKIRMGREGLVGNAISQGMPSLVQDVETSALFRDSQDLPQTRSALALPLQARGEILGALDVQATEPGAFGDDDVELLQVLANQVALAISNAQLLRQAEESLAAMQRAYGELSREGWSEAVYTGRVTGYYCDASGVEPVATRAQPDDDGRPPARLPAASLPLTMRGLVIGTVDAHKPDGTSEWTPEEMALLEGLVDQLEVALESARLYQDTQRRAAQERLMSEVAARMRETLDTDTVLRTAIREIGEALDLAEVEVRLGEPAGFRVSASAPGDDGGGPIGRGEHSAGRGSEGGAA